MKTRIPYEEQLREHLLSAIEAKRETTSGVRQALGGVSQQLSLSPRARAIVLAAVVSVGILVPLAALRGLGSDSKPTHRAAATGLSGTPTVTDTIRLPRGITDIVTGEGAVWAASPSAVLKLDPSTDSVIARIPVAGIGDSGQLATGAGAVWVALPDRVVRINAVTNQVEASIPVVPTIEGIAASDSAVFVSQERFGGSIMEIDPTSNTIVGSPIRLLGDAGELAVLSDGLLWAASSTQGGSGALVDPKTGEVTSQSVTSSEPAAFMLGDFWVAESGRSVTRITEGGARIAYVSLARVVGVEAGLGGVWALTATGSLSDTVYEPDPATPATVVLIDPGTNEPVGPPVPVGVSPIQLAVGEGAAWAAQYDSGVVSKIQVLAA
jgi:DNA-binding beta-propeller fold protein YncE